MLTMPILALSLFTPGLVSLAIRARLLGNWYQSRRTRRCTRRRQKVHDARAMLTCSLGYVGFAWGCTFPPAVQAPLPEVLQNPHAYARQEVEISGLVMKEPFRRRDFAYWHFHLRQGDAEMICYSKAYRTSAWSTLEHVIRRAAATGKEVSVVGYVVRWGADRSVFRLRLVRYENRTYNAEFIPPAVTTG